MVRHISRQPYHGRVQRHLAALLSGGPELLGLVIHEVAKTARWLKKRRDLVQKRSSRS